MASWLLCVYAIFEEGVLNGEFEVALLLSAEDEHCLGYVTRIWRGK